MMNFAQIGIIASNGDFANAFLITGSELDILNRYIDVFFDPNVYHSSGGGVVSSDFQIVFTQNSGVATACSISSITNTSGGSLSGGETTVRVNLSFTGNPSGVELIEIKPSIAGSYKDSNGRLCSINDSTGQVIIYKKLDALYSAGILYFLTNSISVPPLAQRLIDNALFVNARADGWLTECDLIYLFTESSACSRFEFVSGTYIGTYTGTVTIDRYLGGIASSGGRFNTGWIPSTNGVKYLQNSASLIAVINNNAQSADAIAGVRGNASGANFGRTKVSPRTGPGTATTIVNTNLSGTNISVAVASSADIFHLTRNAASGTNAEKLFVGGVDKASSTATSSTVSNKQLYAFCENNNGSATTSNVAHQLMALIMGSDMRSYTSQINTTLASWRTNSLAQTAAYSGKLYSWIGQSNMGRSDSLSTLSSGEAAIYNNGPISIANGYDGNFYIWWNNEWALLEPGLNGYTFDADQFSPLFAFAVAETSKYPGEDLFCVFEVVGGTSLAGAWLPPSGARYVSYISKYADALAQLSVTSFMPVYWGQGEKDSQDLSNANAYEANEQTLFTSLFAGTGHTIGIVMQVNINIATTYVSTVRTAKSNNLAANKYSASGDLINIDDLPVHDGFHLSVTNSITFAQRMSAAYP